MDNDFGDHWFDNWELRERIEDKAAALGIDANDLLIIDPDRFGDGRDITRPRQGNYSGRMCLIR